MKRSLLPFLSRHKQNTPDLPIRKLPLGGSNCPMALEEPVIVKDPRAENEALAYLLGCLISVQETPGAIPDPTQTWRNGLHFAIPALRGYKSRPFSVVCPIQRPALEGDPVFKQQQIKIKDQCPLVYGFVVGKFDFSQGDDPS